MTHHSRFTVTWSLLLPWAYLTLRLIFIGSMRSIQSLKPCLCGCLAMPASQPATEQKGKELDDIFIFCPKYRWLFQCILNSIAPKKGDHGMVWAYSIDLMYYSRKAPARPIDMADFLWHEICMASCLKVRTLPRAPFI